MLPLLYTVNNFFYHKLHRNDTRIIMLPVKISCKMGEWPNSLSAILWFWRIACNCSSADKLVLSGKSTFCHLRSSSYKVEYQYLVSEILNYAAVSKPMKSGNKMPNSKSSFCHVLAFFPPSIGKLQCLLFLIYEI